MLYNNVNLQAVKILPEQLELMHTLTWIGSIQALTQRKHQVVCRGYMIQQLYDPLGQRLNWSWGN